MCKVFWFTHGDVMFEKDLNVGYLLDFYGDVLSERHRSIMEMYYSDDLSLAEIAENEGISRQGIRHIIKKCEEELRFLEERLGLATQFATLRHTAEDMLSLSARLQARSEDEDMLALSEKMRQCALTLLSASSEEESPCSKV